MKTVRLNGLCAAAAALLAGCESMSHTQRGMGVGSAVGAGAGALIGSTKGKAGAGALIGGAGGALVGALAGSERDQAEKQQTEARLAVAEARAAQPQLSLDDIGQMARSGQSDAVIIGQIRATGSTYRLTAEQLNWLKQNGVGDSVILEMQRSARRPVVVEQAPVVVAPPPPVFVAPRPVYVVPPPRPSFGVGVHIH